jgi:hypothetical protein
VDTGPSIMMRIGCELAAAAASAAAAAVVGGGGNSGGGGGGGGVDETWNTATIQNTKYKTYL